MTRIVSAYHSTCLPDWRGGNCHATVFGFGVAMSALAPSPRACLTASAKSRSPVIITTVPPDDRLAKFTMSNASSVSTPFCSVRGRNCQCFVEFSQQRRRRDTLDSRAFRYWDLRDSRSLPLISANLSWALGRGRGWDGGDIGGFGGGFSSIHEQVGGFGGSMGLPESGFLGPVSSTG